MDMLAYIRRACMRHETAIALAFRRALGLPEDTPTRTPSGYPSDGVYDGMAECFENRKRVRL